MNTEEMRPGDALEEARYITAFLGASVSAFGRTMPAAPMRTAGRACSSSRNC